MAGLAFPKFMVTFATSNEACVAQESVSGADMSVKTASGA
jgi:hypothetical protein